jgi:peptidyl-tRNA hydrolase, PTH1 family
MAESFPFLIAGLGNPGEKYASTRHNIGFWAIDELKARLRVGAYQNKFKAEYALVSSPEANGTGAILLKPQTFMNLSGESIAEAVRFFKIPVATHLLVLVDDIDIPLGALRLRLSGGSGGHNGLKSIIECLGTEAFPRLRIGVGRSPTLPADVWVLSKIPKAEMSEYEKMASLAAEGAERCWRESPALAMNAINRKE